MAFTAIVVGFVAGLFGIGGGLITVPFLYYIFNDQGIDPRYIMHLAVGTSFAIIIPTSISSVLTHHKFNAVDFSTSLGIEYYVNNQISLNTKFSNTLFFTPIRKHASSASLWYNQGQYNTVISFIINYYIINSQ